MNGVVVVDSERSAVNAGKDDRHIAVDVGETHRNHEGDKKRPEVAGVRLSCPSGDRANLLRAHAAKSAECQSSPKARRTPRESRRVSLAQAPGYVQLNQYRLLEPIGQGSYGIVKLAYSEEDDTHYAMKILSKRKLMRRAGLFGKIPPRRPGPGAPPDRPGAPVDNPGPPPDPIQKIYREIAVLKKLDHPNVVKLVEVLDDPAEDQLYLVFQLLEGGPVIDIPTDNPLSEDVARRYFRDAVLGVEYLHYQRIAHRDIKPANLLLGEGGVQLADLGASGELAGAGRLAGAVGTPAFRAPEAAAHADQYIGEAADIWSLGITLYAMVTGRVPWLGSSGAELQRRVISEPLAFPPRPSLSRALKRLLFRMLDKDPATRATMKEIKNHEWVTADGTDPLPSEEENCRLVEVTDEDMAQVVTSIPNLSTLILIKTMLKKHSFQNPFLRSREGSNARRESVDAGAGAGPCGAAGAPGAAAGTGEAPGRKPVLARAGRSLSAPGHLADKQASFDIALESVEEIKERVEQPQSSNHSNGQNDGQNSKKNTETISNENNSNSQTQEINEIDLTNQQLTVTGSSQTNKESKTPSFEKDNTNKNSEKSYMHKDNSAQSHKVVSQTETVSSRQKHNISSGSKNSSVSNKDCIPNQNVKVNTSNVKEGIKNCKTGNEKGEKGEGKRSRQEVPARTR